MIRPSLTPPVPTPPVLTPPVPVRPALTPPAQARPALTQPALTQPAQTGPCPGGPVVVALGGGHGLAASLQALRRLTDRLTAVVTVADDGGSSGRLRHELDVLPPGDLRMALAALCGDDEWGQTWSRVLQHRFGGTGPLCGHAVGNLLMVALWEQLGDTVAGLDWLGRLLEAHGRVLPMSSCPLELVASVIGLDPADASSVTTIRGQVAAASTSGTVISVALRPADPPVTPEVVEAIEAADWIVLGPGSWFTSVIPHLLVPGLAAALQRTQARVAVLLNLTPQSGETLGFSPQRHLSVLLEHAPGLQVDLVVADDDSVSDRVSLTAAVHRMGAHLEVAQVRRVESPDQHDPQRLATVLEPLLRAAAAQAGSLTSARTTPTRSSGAAARQGEARTWR